MAELSSLPLFHRIAGQKVLVLGEGEAAVPKRRLVERAGGIVTGDQQRAVDEGVRLAFVAFDDARACEVAAINLRCAGMLVNVVDRPELCDFTTPSILDRNPVLIAVGTAGASAGLAKHLRLRLERILPQSLGQLAQGLFEARERLRARFTDGATRRRALDGALCENGPLDPFDPDAAGRIDDWVAGDTPAPQPATRIITLSTGDPDDLTLREARWLGEADRLLIDGDVPAIILARARADAERLVQSAAQGVWYHGTRPGNSAGTATITQGASVAVSSPATGDEAAPPEQDDGLTVILRWRPEY